MLDHMLGDAIRQPMEYNVSQFRVQGFFHHHHLHHMLMIYQEYKERMDKRDAN